MKLTLLALCSLGLAVPDPFSPTGISALQCGPNKDNSDFWDNMAHVFPGIRPPPNSLNTRSSPVCIKFIASMMNGQQQTMRSCTLFGSSACDALTGMVAAVNGKVHACETCKEELCNSAPRDLLAVFTVLVSSLVLVLRSF
ncbi:hypothetical protein B566_EDAN007300 [Ephemera danica]|nr:hypothetical protein B566_EDAN007300 [Ephemera danica]